MYKLTEELRNKLKKPIGTLIRGDISQTIRKIREIINKENPLKIISIGDAISQNLVNNDIVPQLLIIDNKIMRKKITPFLYIGYQTISIRNPPGTITSQAIKTVQKFINTKNNIEILVEGEEDLLALPAILFAPENSLIIYGQPFEGVVVVKSTDEKKEQAARILELMNEDKKT